jgi:hypothetical protein
MIIYFLRGLLTNRLKVGISTHFDKRLDHIRGHNFDDVEVLGIIPGDEALEREIHAELSEWHNHHEFFDYTPESAAIVDKYLHPETIGVSDLTPAGADGVVAQES